MKITLKLFTFFLQSTLSLSLENSPSKTSSSIQLLFSTPQGQSLAYPPLDVPGPKPRAAWLKAYRRVKNAGLIPSVPASSVVDGSANYPASFEKDPCNFGATLCNRTTDIINGPPGVAGVSFDDGPQAPSIDLLNFLKTQKQKATHFLIGNLILRNLETFQAMDQAKEHFAVHTYTHPMMTSLSDEQIVGELGWAMQVIRDHSAQKVLCSLWRPPYGDVDDRVRAIAKHVFGLDTVLWGYDPRDWCLADTVPNGSACAVGNGPQNLEGLVQTLEHFARLNKSKGLIVLEHESHVRTVQAFKHFLPSLRKLDWITKTIPDMLNRPWYQATN